MGPLSVLNEARGGPDAACAEQPSREGAPAWSGCAGKRPGHSRVERPCEQAGRSACGAAGRGAWGGSGQRGGASALVDPGGVLSNSLNQCQSRPAEGLARGAAPSGRRVHARHLSCNRRMASGGWRTAGPCTPRPRLGRPHPAHACASTSLVRCRRLARSAPQLRRLLRAVLPLRAGSRYASLDGTIALLSPSSLAVIAVDWWPAPHTDAKAWPRSRWTPNAVDPAGREVAGRSAAVTPSPGGALPAPTRARAAPFLCREAGPLSRCGHAAG
ncbi:hypothetical protein U9M48_036700 [Paspalum notatum var. saurae]|uniref:Uncharacterized protein n=1 Tax=Paspalum notatum var. saurae TaxID=547442 RepID=A0AAQ3UEY7_PASNO